MIPINWLPMSSTANELPGCISANKHLLFSCTNSICEFLAIELLMLHSIVKNMPKQRGQVSRLSQSASLLKQL